MKGANFLSLTVEERREMLEYIGVDSVEELFNDIPKDLKLQKELDLPPALSEEEALKYLRNMAGKNKNLQDCVSFLGGGVYDHFIPSIVKHVTGRSEFYTAYTPYQAEISQGVLQAIFEYQTMICQLTGMEAANASMYDGATALAEGAVMACAATRRNKVLVSQSVNPFYRKVLEGYFSTRGLLLEEVPIKEGQTAIEKLEKAVTKDIAALVVQTPNFFGLLEAGLDKAAEILHKNKALLVTAVDPLSLPLVQAPAEYGADIVVGEGQGLGNTPSFGGPLLGFFATREKLIRRMPGRVVGETVDNEGKRGFVLTLQTREQHIRRERATSNICSNQALNALAATVYMAAMGPKGMREVSEQCLKKSAYARDKITSLAGYDLAFDGTYFKEFAVKMPKDADEINSHLLKQDILGGVDLAPYYPNLKNHMLLCVTEKRTKEEIDALTAGLEGLK
ncbi:aminomethyl-transferring glycine dehydrogenase subunit GcvPA [Dethiobacter alkaliphilus]|uniref:Probable glycine dehydrogenase (decarboxylating) subunit 1 n=1 Tax=Dethiobacter alkaliphilus AHT 1 TaxID=555088 RepID=C0GKA9_DETAL|nr:aminomethyl-transferring glycine dehydrogenase subunit GcvPA [Dethiobacter alkaliphilus]EEG76224.1 Glycine dehydrogenase (decarboxylating) [Dethiobacter alkaliphilus AHT 1]